MSNMYPTKESQLLSPFEMFVGLIEESTELGGAISKTDIPNVGEELMDVIQWCVNIAHYYNINLNKEVIKHQSKLLQRNHKFILPHEEKIQHIIEGGNKFVRFR